MWVIFRFPKRHKCIMPAIKKAKRTYGSCRSTRSHSGPIATRSNKVDKHPISHSQSLSMNSKSNKIPNPSSPPPERQNVQPQQNPQDIPLTQPEEEHTQSESSKHKTTIAATKDVNACLIYDSVVHLQRDSSVPTSSHNHPPPGAHDHDHDSGSLQNHDNMVSYFCK